MNWFLHQKMSGQRRRWQSNGASGRSVLGSNGSKEPRLARKGGVADEYEAVAGGVGPQYRAGHQLVDAGSPGLADA